MFEAKNIEQHYSLEERLFLEKVRGFCQLVEDRYSPYLTDFLNPREIQIVKDLANYYNLKFFVSSTFDNEEYGRVILAPDYYELDEDDFEIKRLEISYARQFNELTHPKILGALLNQLGLERQVFGDVILDEEGRVQFNIA
ncbi:RNA-binding protein, partial [Lactobacillus reuteri]|nr:RNA-binding protein [Limosilactobacillus reuteri]